MNRIEQRHGCCIKGWL